MPARRGLWLNVLWISAIVGMVVAQIAATGGRTSLLTQNALFLAYDGFSIVLLWMWGASLAGQLRDRPRVARCYCGYPTAANPTGTCPECGRAWRTQRPVPDAARLKILVPIVLSALYHYRAYRAAARVAYLLATGRSWFPPGDEPWPDEAAVHRYWLAPLLALAWVPYAAVVYRRSRRRDRAQLLAADCVLPLRTASRKESPSTSGTGA